MKTERINWDEYFIQIVKLIMQRGTCPRKQAGAILVKDNRIIGTGYNGSPKGMKHCSDIGCLLLEEHCIRTVHAEQNALLQAGKESKGSIVYVTMMPCPICIKLLIQAGVKKVIYIKDDYSKPWEKQTKYWIKNSKIKVIEWKD